MKYIFWDVIGVFITVMKKVIFDLNSNFLIARDFLPLYGLENSNFIQCV